MNRALSKISGSWDQELLARMLVELNLPPAVDLTLSGFGEDEVKKPLKNLEARDKLERPETSGQVLRHPVLAAVHARNSFLRVARESRAA